MKKQYLFVLILIVVSQLSIAQVLTPITDSITMRDGKKLAADIYLPDTGQSYPVILIQTPYNRLHYRLGLPLQIGLDIENSPYAFVIVDWRCFYGSVAACIALPERGKDGYDVIDWISKQNWSDGKIGTWGPSALGKIQYLTAREQHPNHRCAVPVVAGSQFEYQEYFPNGVLRTEYVDQLDALGYNMKTTLLQHPYYDAWWQYVENANMYPDKIKIPMFLIGGWFDHNIDLMFDLFDTLQKASDLAVRDLHKFLVGPWSHNSVGNKKVGELEFPEAEGASDSFALLFFDYWLRGAKNGWPIHKQYLLYPIKNNNPAEPLEQIDQFNAHLNEYKETSLFINSGSWGGLTNSPGNNNDSILVTYDPKNPSPSIGGPTLRIDLKQGPIDIKEDILHRNDNVLLNAWIPTETALKMIGKPKLDLYVSSNRFDTDFNVRLVEVNDNVEPNFDTSCVILSDIAYRMRFSNGFKVSDTQTIIPGKIYKITLELPFIYTTFDYTNSPGIVISSSNYPRFDLNLNNGKELYQEGDTLIAHNYIYYGPDYPSRLYFQGKYVYGVIEESSIGPLIRTYPNPTQNTLYIDPQKIQPPFSYSISDLQGKEMMRGEIKEAGVFSLDVSVLEAQVYLLRVSNSKQSNVAKVIKVD